MTRFRVFLFIFAVTLGGALFSAKPLWWSLSGAVLALILSSIVWAWTGVHWVRVARRSVTRVAQVGQEFDEEFRLTNLSRLPKLWVEVSDQSTLPGHYASRVIGLIWGGQWRGWRVRTVCLRRGRFQLGPFEIRCSDPLGIWQSARALNVTSAMIVQPMSYEFRGLSLPHGFLPGGDTLRRRTHFVTTNASSLRDYVPGDGINRIHWGASAKRQRLVVKEFDLDPRSDVWIALDLDHTAHFAQEPAEPTLTAQGYQLPPDTAEYAISIAATLARHFVHQDRSLGMVAHAIRREVLPADNGERQLSRVMEELAVVQVRGVVPFDRVLRAEAPMFGRGSTVIAISASADLEWTVAVAQLLRSGVRIVAVVIDRASFGDEAHPPADVIAALAEAGATVRVVRMGEPIAEALERASAPA